MNIERTEPGPGQESVWDYPRPPRVEPCAKRIRMIYSGVTIADPNGVQALRREAPGWASESYVADPSHTVHHSAPLQS
jgi:uncharacterized protein (DUF427 family)